MSRRDLPTQEAAAASPYPGSDRPASTLVPRIVKWAYNPRDRGPDLFRTLFVINPVVMLPLVILMGGLGGHFWKRYLFALLIGDTVSLTCFALTGLLALVNARIFHLNLRRRNFMMTALLGMLPGLWLGFAVAGRVAGFFGEAWDAPSFADYGTGLTIGSLIFGAIVLLDLWNSSRLRTYQLETETLQAKLSALSAQMNPHLLFNALNTIASTIPSDPRAAEETTLRLSELYRGILASSKKTTQPLSVELEICRAYLGVESARFSDRLRWSIECEPGLENIEIPSLLIQPLVENAIKHGISQKSRGGSVHVNVTRERDQLRIRVEDDGVGVGHSSHREGTGTGLSSCRSRLQLSYGDQAGVEIMPRPDGPGTKVQIRIPVKQGVPI